ncbi:ABC transporter ATP-binding protein [Planobispora siamensis]|uniref:Multidrug ABC transporter ATP-binding protein n=1 Tax=Planobispora siamensis TaxID=936338 RepID=A0A8J3SAS7_9ACTN|nr:ATP-binding cassette domain-containing protein [Planobispora siamensis]GIH89939.1 multidrug ABC transporter ATP-binding protein [Planobispora siamensis]
MEATIEVAGLRKRFGRVVALDGMSFTVTPGRVTGLVGPGGAGKSTTMRVILGLVAADGGSALVGGRPYRSLRNPLGHVGASLETGALQPGRTGRDHLLWLARSQGLTAGRVDEVVELTGLGQAARHRAGGYSLGVRQRLGVAAALLGDPPVLMFDEPFDGLGPEDAGWLRGLLRSLAAEGRAVLVSGRLMGELQDTAGHLVVAGHGRVVADTGVAELIAAASGGRVAVRTTARPEAMTALADAGASVAVTGRDMLVVSGMAAERVMALLTAEAVPFSEVTAHRATLEEAYMDLTRDAAGSGAGPAVSPEAAGGAAAGREAAR